MVSKEQKKVMVADLVEKLGRSGGVYLVDFTGVTAPESIAFRRQFRDANAELKVAKNTLLKRAIAEVGTFELPDDKYIGQTAVAFGYDDPVAPARVIKKIVGDTKKLDLKAAVVDGQVFDGSQLKQVASLPTREDLIAGILGSLNAPASGIVGAINAVMRDLASVIEESAKAREAA